MEKKKHTIFLQLQRGGGGGGGGGGHCSLWETHDIANQSVDSLHELCEKKIGKRNQIHLVVVPNSTFIGELANQL